MSGKRTLYISIAAAAIPLGFLLARPDRDAPAGETRLCAWNLAAIDVRSAPSVAGGPNGDLCDVSADGLKLSFKVFAATESDKVVNTQGITRYYTAATQASKKPDFDVSPAKYLSLPYLLFGNRAPFTVYSAPDRQRGYLVAEISDHLVIVGLWASDTPISASQISSFLRIRINPAGDAKIWAIWTKLDQLWLTLFACLPLGLVWFSRPIFSKFDQWWNLHTISGFIVYAGLVPAALLGFVWMVFLIVGWSTALVLAATFTAIALVQIALRLAADRSSRLPLTPFSDPDPKIFHKFRAAEDSVEVAGAEIPIAHSVDVQMWFPRSVDCAGCGMRYAVYVPASSSKSLSHEISKTSGIPLEMQKELFFNAALAAPRLVNGCIRCGRPLPGTPSKPIVKRDEPLKLDAKSALIALGAAALAMALVGYSTPIARFCEKLPLVGRLLGYIFDELSGLAIFFLTLPLIILIWQVLSGLADRSAKHGSGPYRMTACPKDKIVFEDIAAERDPICPSCGGQLEPLRRFRIATV
jgi:hypothetical protein